MEHSVHTETLPKFYDLMNQTAVMRRTIVDYYLMNIVNPEHIQSLRNALHALEKIPRAEENNGRKVLNVTDEGPSFEVDLGYETTELEKDLVFLAHGEEALLEFMATMHSGFRSEVKETSSYLSDQSSRLFITDRDGTVNNYCGRYRSSIQSVYNAVFLTRFARRKARNPVILTSAPLTSGGLVDVSVNPRQVFVYAGSKGREYLDADGARHSFPIPEDKQKALSAFNDRLASLLSEKEFQIFALIGSGVQYKFGQTAVSRQDINGSVEKSVSMQFKERVESLVREVDPDKSHLATLDTGYDIEVILTEEKAGGQGTKDFDKGDGVEFLNASVPLEMDHHPILMCGDTPSDLPMLETACRHSSDVKSVFVTQDEKLRSRVHSVLPEAHFVSNPDVLVTSLYQLVKESAR